MHSHARRAAVAVLSAGALVLPLASPASADGHVSDPLADGLVGPLKLSVAMSGGVYVAETFRGALTRIDIRGRGGRSLREDWFTEIRTTMGLAKRGYPNLLTTAVPLAPSAALCNMTTCLQQQTEWITGLIRHMQARGKKVVEPSAALEDAWVRHHDEVAGPYTVVKPITRP